MGMKSTKINFQTAIFVPLKSSYIIWDLSETGKDVVNF